MGCLLYTSRILIAEKVPTPGFINFQRDGTFANIYAGAPEEKSYAWTIAQVKSIMTVSYTHLDVYKRQVEYALRRGIEIGDVSIPTE